MQKTFFQRIVDISYETVYAHYVNSELGSFMTEYHEPINQSANFPTKSPHEKKVIISLAKRYISNCYRIVPSLLLETETVTFLEEVSNVPIWLPCL